MIRVGRLRRDQGISVARPTLLGNPFIVGEHGTRRECIVQYRSWFLDALYRRADMQAQLAYLVALARSKDLTLLCWCRTVDQTDPPCHADVIADRIRAKLWEAE